jgi:hypothetical protein
MLQARPPEYGRARGALARRLSSADVASPARRRSVRGRTLSRCVFSARPWVARRCRDVERAATISRRSECPCRARPRALSSLVDVETSSPSPDSNAATSWAPGVAPDIDAWPTAAPRAATRHAWRVLVCAEAHFVAIETSNAAVFPHPCWARPTSPHQQNTNDFPTAALVQPR